MRLISSHTWRIVALVLGSWVPRADIWPEPQSACWFGRRRCGFSPLADIIVCEATFLQFNGRECYFEAKHCLRVVKSNRHIRCFSDDSANRRQRKLYIYGCHVLRYRLSGCSCLTSWLGPAVPLPRLGAPWTSVAGYTHGGLQLETAERRNHGG